VSVQSSRGPDVGHRLAQLGRYLDQLSLDQGTLVIFDQRKEAAPFAGRGSRENRNVDGRDVLVLRL